MRLLIGMCLLLVIAGCRGERLQWVRDRDECPGGRIDTQRRIVDTRPDGITRTTMTRTNACIE